MAEKSIEVSAIEITTKDGTTVRLTLDEARELHEQLQGLFRTPQITFVPAPAPIIIRERYPWINPWGPVWTTTNSEFGGCVTLSGARTSMQTRLLGRTTS